MERFKQLVVEKTDEGKQSSGDKPNFSYTRSKLEELCLRLKPIKTFSCSTAAQREVDGQNAVIRQIKDHLKKTIPIEFVDLWEAMPYPKDGGTSVLYPLRYDDPYAPRSTYHITRFHRGAFTWLSNARNSWCKHDPIEGSKIPPGAKV